MKAASLPDHPAYLPGLATRMAAEAGSPDTALAFLEARWQETHDQATREALESRMKEVIIERDLQVLERAVDVYHATYEAFPMTLAALVNGRIVTALPQEPFGGEYLLDSKTGRVSSSSHPNRLRTFTKFKQAPAALLPKIEPAYVFPRTWE